MHSRARVLAVVSALHFAVASAQAGTLQFAPPSRDFGNVSVAAGAVLSTITITNIGSSTRIDGFTPTGGCGEFSVTPGVTLPVLLGNNQSMDVTVGYDPTNRTADVCTVTILDDNGVADSFQLIGDGVAPVVAVTPSQLFFADQVWSSGVHETLNLTITNLGELPFAASNLGRVLTTGTHFSLDEPIGTFPVGNGESVMLPVTFDPTSIGAKTDLVTVSLDNDSPAEPNPTVQLWGTGTDVTDAPALSVTHGIRAVGPSPSRGLVWAQIAFARAGTLDVEVFDTSGRLAARAQSVEGSAGARTVEFRAGSDWSPRSGIYFIRARLDAEVLGARRIALVR